MAFTDVCNIMGGTGVEKRRKHTERHCFLESVISSGETSDKKGYNDVHILAV